MSEQFTAGGYQITTDKRLMNKQLGITPELETELENLYFKIQTKTGPKTLKKITQLIEQYPTVPQLKNYLSVAYNTMGNKTMSQQVNQQLLETHPDYLFAKLNQASVFIERGEYQRVPELLGPNLDLKQLYPHRQLFHLSEVTGYLKLTISYFAAMGNREMAEEKLALLKKIAPNHPDTQQAEPLLWKLRMEKFAARLEADEARRIKPDTSLKVLPAQTTEAPVFTHPEIGWLYENEFDIAPAKIESLLALPRQTLIADLEKVLADGAARYNYFNEMEYDESQQTFVLHALFLLKELKATESWDAICDFLSLNDEITQLWLGEHVTESLWQCFYALGADDIQKLKSFILRPGVDAYIKGAASSALCQMVLHQPLLRNPIMELYKELFIAFANVTESDNLLDPELYALCIGDTIDCNLPELLPQIKELFELDFVSYGMNGDYNDVKQSFGKNPADFYRRDVKTIFELYEEFAQWGSDNRSFDDDDDNYDFDDTDSDKNVLPDWNSNNNATQPAVADKINRNDPCPCGSGKKYKKCCMK